MDARLVDETHDLLVIGLARNDSAWFDRDAHRATVHAGRSQRLLRFGTNFAVAFVALAVDRQCAERLKARDRSSS